jgi:hypothetical protein
MQPMYYIGLDVHKRKISYCVKDGSGRVYAEGWIPATRIDLDRWMKTLPQPSPITSDRQRRKQECISRTVRGSDFTIFAIH